MTSPQSPSSPSSSVGSSSSSVGSASTRPSSAAPVATSDSHSVDGSTDVLPAVVQKVTAFAAREIPGVVGLGGSSASRAVGAVRQTLSGGGDNLAGVRVDLEQSRASIALDVQIEYGVGAKELVRALRRHVPEAVDEIAGVTVTKLDITITDVQMPGGDDNAS